MLSKPPLRLSILDEDEAGDGGVLKLQQTPPARLPWRL